MIQTEKPKRPRRRPTSHPTLAVGQRHSSLVLVEPVEKNKWGQAMWKCKCVCGTFTTAKGTEISRGIIVRCRPCGDKARAESNRGRRSPFRVDLIGQTFGKLAVIAPAPTRNRLAFWLCRCACGVEQEISAHVLRHGRKSSCGCSRHERASKAKPEKVKKAREPKDAAPPAPRPEPKLKFENPSDAPQPKDHLTALIVASRRTVTRWSEISELVGLPVEECKARHAEATGGQ